MPSAAALSGLSGETGWPWNVISPRVGLQRAGNDAHQRRFAGAVLAENRVHFALVELDADVLQARERRRNISRCRTAES